VTHHGEGLFRLTQNRHLVDAIKKDHRAADIGEKNIAMLDYAVKLTAEPCGCRHEDVEELRKHGFKDADILDIVQVTAYYAFVNRLACGLGVELEGYWDER
jgi:uncharacterized peroxidase-related enzyme